MYWLPLWIVCFLMQKCGSNPRKVGKIAIIGLASVSWVSWNIWRDWNHKKYPETRPVSWSRISAAGTNVYVISSNQAPYPPLDTCMRLLKWGFEQYHTFKYLGLLKQHRNQKGSLLILKKHVKVLISFLELSLMNSKFKLDKLKCISTHTANVYRVPIGFPCNVYGRGL